MKNEFKKPGAHKPTDKQVLSDTIGRDAAEYTVRNVPQFEVALVRTRTPFIAFMHSLVKPDFRRF